MGYSPELGYIKDTFEEFKERIEERYINSFGRVDIDPDSPLGQVIAIPAESLAQLSEGVASVYNSGNPDTATGFNLDGIADYLGVKRLSATATTVTAVLFGDNQTLVKAGNQATATGVNTIFSLVSDVLITNEACYGAVIKVQDVNSPTFSLIINYVEFTHEKTVEDTLETIVESVITLINNSDLEVVAENVNNDIFVYSNVNKNVLQVYLLNGLQITSVLAAGQFEAVDKGKISLPAGTLRTIATPVGGWLSITNFSAGEAGRNLETDDELRVRRTLSTKLGGTGTVEAIRARLLNTKGVTSATVKENYTHVTDEEGRPPNSFECLVLGGDDKDIGDTIWQVRTAGIQTFGNVAVFVLDSVGTQHSINFSRPVKLYVYVKVTITKNGFYPANGDSLIKERIAKQINASNVNETVFYQSLYQSVYSVNGVVTAEIKIGGSLDEVQPELVSENLIVSTAQIAVTDAFKINIEIA